MELKLVGSWQTDEIYDVFVIQKRYWGEKWMKLMNERLKNLFLANFN